MNKTAIFILGVVLGGAAGAAATYYISKNKFESDKDEEIAEMEEYYEERYQKKLNSLNHPKTIKTVPDEVEGTDKDLREDEKVTNNEGVKKYHHDNGLESAYGSTRIFGEDAKPKVKKESKLINEISEQEFLNAENGYDKQTVDVFVSMDDEEPEIVGIWAYETDNEEPVDKRFNKSIEQLLNGRTYDDLCAYVEEGEDIGQLYLKNDELKIDFEFVVHTSTN